MFELFTAKSGASSARIKDANGKSRLLHSAIDPEREMQDLPLPEIWGDVVLCLGTGLGYHLRRLPHVRELVLCDVYYELRSACHQALALMADHIYTLDPNDLQAVQALRKCFPDHAKIQILRHPASYRFNANTYENVARIWVSAPLANKAQKPRVLFLYGQHFLQEEVRHGLEEYGCETRLLEYERTTEYGQLESTINRALQEFQPDFLLSINMKGIDSEGVVLSSATRCGVATHVWFVDDPRPIVLAYPAHYFAQIHAWCWERAYLPWLVQKGFAQPHWLPLAGDPKLFSFDQTFPPHRHGIVFTGSAMGPEFLGKIQRSFLWDARMAPLVEDRSEALLQGRCSLWNLLNDVKLPFVDERNRTWLNALIIHTASHKKRIRFLQTFTKQELLLAGDPQGWLQALGPQAKAINDINYRQELAQHYRSCQVNLNLTSAQMPSAVNQRVFDVPLVGGFVLTDAQSDLQELFEPAELATFKSAEELADKARYYLHHAQERHRISQAARAKILQRHTYVHRLQTMFAER